jgi:uncharacterized caspase-like protein
MKPEPSFGNSAGRRLALIVATSLYEADEELASLTAPAQDAKDLADVLADPSIAGFSVDILLNSPSYEANEAIDRFLGSAGRNDMLIVYFSCHGIKDEGGRLYFASTNTRRSLLRSTAISAALVRGPCLVSLPTVLLAL